MKVAVVRETAPGERRVALVPDAVGKLRAAGVEVEGPREHENGRFGWATDPEGNRFELWQPPPGS